MILPPFSMSNLEHARSYAKFGIPVLPLHYPIFEPEGVRCSCPGGLSCAHIGKHPIPKSGLNDASTDPTRIKWWFTRHPTANIGLQCGFYFDVLDVDDPELAETLLGDPSALYYSRSGPIALTGRGVHFYFEPKGGPSRSTPGYDWKSTGYVVAPPSLHASGARYRWVEGATLEVPPPLPSRALLEEVHAKRVPAWRSTTPSTLRPSDEEMPVGLEDLRDLLPRPTNPTLYVQKAVEGEARAVATAPEGVRNTMLNRAAFNVGRALRRVGLTPEDIDVVSPLLAAAVANGYVISHSERQALATIWSGLNAGLKA